MTPRHQRQRPAPEPRLTGEALLDARVPLWREMTLNEFRRALFGCQPGERSKLRAIFNAVQASDEVKYSKAPSPPKPAKPAKTRAKRKE